MLIFAVYFPTPQEFANAVFLLVFVYGVMCWLAHRLRLSVPLAAVLMLVGCLAALAPTIIRVQQVPVGSFDYARQISPNNCSDAFLAFTSYLHVGNGKLTAFAGMCVPLFAYAAIARMQDWRRSAAIGEAQSRAPNTEV